MIIGQKKHEVVDLLNRSEFNFFLTGSRFFGCVHAASDYDYFVQDSLAVRRFLEDNGFTKRNNKYAKDSLCAIIYRKEDVDIQVVKDERVKHMAQEALVKILVRPAPRDWEVAYAVAKLMLPASTVCQNKLYNIKED